MTKLKTESTRSALRYRVARSTSEACCGSCTQFTDEDMSGGGWCLVHKKSASCERVCDAWVKRSEKAKDATCP
jgi:hypothetical protein